MLLLTIHDYEIPAYAVSNDFYRQALALDFRKKREYMDAILSAMGGIDKARFSQYKALLNLSDDAIELADRHQIDERKLRYVLALPTEFHVEIIRQIIDFNLTSSQVKVLCESDGDPDTSSDEFDKLPPSALKIAKVAQNATTTSPQDVARALMRQEGDANIARARLQAMQKLLTEAEHYLASD